MFNSKFSKEFLDLKNQSLFVLKYWKFQRKIESFGKWFLILISISIWRFSQVFFLIVFISNHVTFSHLSYLSILSIRILFCKENWFVVVDTTKCCNLILFEFPLMWRWVWRLCWYPSSERWLWRLCLVVGIPLVRGDCGGVWLCWYPSRCRGDCGCCFALSLIPLLRGWLLFG